jgi:ubiquinone biosynthesis protein UbiJ
MPATPTWLGALEALLNRSIQSSAQAGTLAARLNASTLKLRIDGIAPVRVATAGGRLSLTASDEPADASIGGSPFALLQLARGGAPMTGRSAPAQIEGDAEVANRYRQLFSLARPDFEEELARIVGDLPARRLSQFARRTIGWVRRTKRTTGENIAEYLQEESRDLVNAVELEEFLQGVDAVRETADRIEARLARLEQRMKGTA